MVQSCFPVFCIIKGDAKGSRLGIQSSPPNGKKRKMERRGFAISKELVWKCLKF